MKAATAAMRAAILCYRYALSPVLPGACRFQPSCSQYALEAVSRFGARKGGWLMLRRLARCHPWGGSGYDPVPPGGQDESSVVGCRRRGQGRQEDRRSPCQMRSVEE
jgi:hypothetical protein